MKIEIGATYDPESQIETEALKQFSAEAHSVDLKVDAEFQRILREAQALLETSDQEIADALSVSRPTVNRWMNGKNLPHNAMRKPILTRLILLYSSRSLRNRRMSY